MSTRRILVFACLAAMAPAGIGFVFGVTRFLTEDLVSPASLALVRVLTIAVVEISLFGVLAYIQEFKRLHHVAVTVLIAALLASMLGLLLGVILRSFVAATSSSVPAFDVGSAIGAVVWTSAMLFSYAGLGGLLGYFAARARSRTLTQPSRS